MELWHSTEILGVMKHEAGYNHNDIFLFFSKPSGLFLSLLCCAGENLWYGFSVRLGD